MTGARLRAPAQMKDVAERAGVSMTTVSHIVNGTRAVAPDTRERVLRAMEELRYRRNAFGSRLARGRGDSYGLIVSDIENPFYPGVIKSFERAAIERGAEIVLGTTNYDARRARLAVDRMLENRARGVAVLTSQIDLALVDELVESGVPVVRLDAPRRARGLRSRIRIDYSAGVREAAAHLRECGHSRVALLTGPLNRTSAATYRDALLLALKEHRIAVARVLEGGNDAAGGEAGVRALLSGGAPPGALLCGNDLAAIGAIRALAEAGWRVPEDVSVIGSDDIPFAQFMRPALTTVRIPRDELGGLAFDLLDRMAHGGGGRDAWVRTGLVVRESTGRRAGRAVTRAAVPQPGNGEAPAGPYQS